MYQLDGERSTPVVQILVWRCLSTIVANHHDLLLCTVQVTHRSRTDPTLGRSGLAQSIGTCCCEVRKSHPIGALHTTGCRPLCDATVVGTIVADLPRPRRRTGAGTCQTSFPAARSPLTFCRRMSCVIGQRGLQFLQATRHPGSPASCGYSVRSAVGGMIPVSRQEKGRRDYAFHAARF